MTPPMDNWKSPNQEQESSPTEMPLEERLRALEQQVAQHQTVADKAAPADAPGQHAWHPGLDMPEAPAVAQLATVSADLDAHRNQLRNAEMSLVDRIADVDDERRRTTTRLQKAWQTHRDEVDDQLRRHTWSTVALLVLFAALIGGFLFFTYRQIGIEQHQLASQLAAIKADLDRVSASPSPDDQQNPEPTQLSARLDELSITVAKLSETWQQTEPPSAPDEQQSADARIAAEIKQLEDRQQRASQELESLLQALGSAQTTDRNPPLSIDEDTLNPMTDLSVVESDTGATDSDNSIAQAPTGTTSTTEQDIAAYEETIDSGTQADATHLVQQGAVIVGDRPYALQLIGVRSRKSLLDFARRDDLPPEVYFREETYRGRPWFVLIHSLHETADAAASEIARLPRDLASLGPWIRSMDEGSKLLVLDTPQAD